MKPTQKKMESGLGDAGGRVLQKVTGDGFAKPCDVKRGARTDLWLMSRPAFLARWKA